MLNFAKKKKKKGFTLIELLVVIAIIGILATIVIVNVNTARNKANDVAIKAALDQVRAQAELYYDGTGNGFYTGLSTTIPSDMVSIGTSITSNGGSGYAAYATSGTYCAKATLKTAGAGAWCVDSTGYVGTTSATYCVSIASSTCK
jgi:prepilin-type N-terminal cleavage/methylation domain-containing protein